MITPPPVPSYPGRFGFPAVARISTLLGLLTVASFSAPAQVQGIAPVVAIHDSELTRALESMPAAPPTPATTGFQWWTTDWHYFLMPDSVKEALRSDGTAFTVISDANITSGLLRPNGRPKYPIIISLASEAIRDNEIASLTNYVAAGGFLMVGSSSFTRNPDGTSRGDFAIAEAMGIHMVNSNLQNWAVNSTFNRQSNHRLVGDIPAGTLNWRMPSYSEEISWGTSPTHYFLAPHDLWQVQATDATILAWGDSRPFIVVKKYGKGFFIYHAAFQPLVGHGGFAPGTYSYVVFRRAIEWAFESLGLAVPKLSPWPYPYDSAFMVRHDLENFQSEIAHVEASSQVEFNAGVRGDYYFTTGTLRSDMGPAGYNTNLVIESMKRAITNYGATLANHNGGLPNPGNPALSNLSYDYWHWGPDEVLELTPAGYANGKAYALASLSNAFSDTESWFPGLSPGGLRLWVSPSFNSTREDSYDIQAQLGVRIAGDQKIGPFPHWTLSTRTPGKIYPFLSQPVSDWFVGGLVAQSLDPWHPPGVHTSATMHEAVDYYYKLGALVNFYSHTLATGEGDAGQLVPDYINYSMDTNLHPRMWPANAALVYQWWLQRSNARTAVLYATNGNHAVTMVGLRGATDPNTTVEVLLPNSRSIRNLQVFLDSAPADPANYRLTNQLVKLKVGNTFARAQVAFTMVPTARHDFYITQQSTALNPAAPGVLFNDSVGASVGALSASLLTPPSHGALTLQAIGSFNYTPDEGFTGGDSFTYRAGDGLDFSDPATVDISVLPPGILFADDFSAAIDPAPPDPWLAQLGPWSVTGGQMQGQSLPNSYTFAAFENKDWRDYTVQGRVQFSTIGGLGGGIGGRLNPKTGAHYGAWVYPDASAGGSKLLKLIKFRSWLNWSGIPMSAVALPAVDTNVHLLAMSFQGPNITVNFDGVPMINVTDNNFDASPAYTNGGITLDMYGDATPFTFSADDVVVSALAFAPIITSQPTNVAAGIGANVSFAVAAAGSGTLAYQWFKNGSQQLADAGNISGSTTPTLNLANVSSGDAGGYSVVVSNASGSVTSVTATLTFFTPPGFASQPTNVVANAGDDVSFAVSATGTDPLTYQWSKNGNQPLTNGGNISGSTSATLSLTNVAAADAGSYAVTVTNEAGSAVSETATLTVIEPPVITSQPQNRTNLVGTDATFIVAATGTALNYQWRFNDANIAGATSSQYVRPSVQSADAGNYSVVVSNSAGHVTSSTAVLTVVQPQPANIQTEPEDRTVIAGQSATFTVVATGTSPLSYHWRLNKENIPGATNASYTVTHAQVSNAGQYSVVVTNAYGSDTSSPAYLTVNYSLTINSGTGGSVLVLPSQSSYAPGSTVVLTATPALGYLFSGWSGNASGILNPLIITMDSNKTINASFTPLLGGLIRARALRE
jgi:hypothetical protein